MPVFFVNAASEAFGGGSLPSATVIVAPRVLLEPPLAPFVEQPVARTSEATATPAATPRAYLRM
jgi:hypothetical protein